MLLTAVEMQIKAFLWMFSTEFEVNAIFVAFVIDVQPCQVISSILFLANHYKKRK